MKESLSKDQLDIALDCLDNPDFIAVYTAELIERREDMIAELIKTGKEEFRFKVQMLDEILELRDEIVLALKEKKESDG